MKTRLVKLFSCLSGLACFPIIPICAYSAPHVANPSKPNVVIIYADDLGYGDLGCYGATKVKTPNIDRLATEGRRFTDAHSASAVCTPSRYALLTGDYPLRYGKSGTWGPLGHTSGLLIGTDRQTLGKVFQESGYATACVGKWHLGFSVDQLDWNQPLRPGPLEVGFDYYFGVPKVNSGHPFVYVENDRIVGWDPNDPIYIDKKNASPTPIFPPEAGRKSPNIFAGAKKAHEIYDDERTASLLVEKASDWIGKNKQKPFFLYLATTNIHHPFTPAPRFKGTSQCGLYGDFIHELDWMVGEVMNCLKANGVADNTLVIFTSDNGGMFNTTGQDAWDAGHRINGDLLGFKFGVWEGGHRIPFIAHWPGKIEAGSVSKQLLCSVDMVATMAALVGVEVKKGHARDSVNLLPTLTGDPQKTIREHLVLAPNKAQCLALRKGKWMYISGKGSGGFTGKNRGDHNFGNAPAISYAKYINSDIENGMIKKDAPPAQLYNLETDLSQTKNLYLQYPEVVKELSALLDREKNSHRESIPPGPRPRSKSASAQTKRKSDYGLYPTDFTYSTAIDLEEGVTRRDPSDVVKVGDTYYVWYSKVTNGEGVFSYPSGYSADVYYATSPDGKQWSEQGLSVGKGGDGAWDEHGVFTPNILIADELYYLFYTGVPKPFDASTKTAIGLAVSDSPDGPWTKTETNPVLLPSEDPDDFDSMRVDDAAFVGRDKKYWFYYKGRQMDRSPGQTKMGVAIADKPEGPYVKHAIGPLHSGHEVMVWPQGKGIVSMATAAGPRMIYYAEDGIEFSSQTEVTNAPRAPGCFREDAFGDGSSIQKLAWGISHAGQKGGGLHLLRFDTQYGPAKSPTQPKQKRNQSEPVAYDNAEPVGNLRFDFETGDLQGWKVVEGEFDLIVSDRPSLTAWAHRPFNKQGQYHLSTVETKDGAKKGDPMTGVIESPRFILEGKAMSFLVGGGNHPDTYVALCTADGKEVLQAGGSGNPILRRVKWDVSAYQGQEVFLRIVDRREKSWAHITFDDFSAEGHLL